MLPPDPDNTDGTPPEQEPLPLPVPTPFPEDIPVAYGDWIDESPNVELVEPIPVDAPAGTDFLEVSPPPPPAETDELVAAALWEADIPIAEVVPVLRPAREERRDRDRDERGYRDREDRRYREERRPRREDRRERACWRCGLYEIPARDGTCRQCDALLTSEDDEWLPPRRRPRRRRGPPRRVDNSSLVTVIVLFGLMMCVSFVWLGIVIVTAAKMDETALLRGTAIFEIVDTFVVLAGIALISRCDFPKQETIVRVTAWMVSMPTFAFMIMLNVAYMAFWRKLLGVEGPIAGPPLTTVVIILFCLQPAFVEEIFFRYLALGVMRDRVGMHGAVWITSLAFALMHIGNPIGMPYLCLVGAFFGYARVWGGMALPIVLHFLHNLAVLAISN